MRDLFEPRRNADQLHLLFAQLALDLGLAYRQHATQLLDRQLAIVWIEQRADLLERQSEIIERDDPMQPWQLLDCVVPVTAKRIRMLGF